MKITRVDFTIGTARAKIDRKAPFTQTLRVASTAVKGKTVTFRARAFIKVSKGRSPKKSIRSTIKVCSMTRRIPLLSLLALALALAATPVAQAGTPFQIGTGGKDPALTVDPVTGTMHAVWSDDPEQRSARYCRVPRGATACDITRDLALTAPDTFTVDEPKIVRAGDGTLHVVTTRYVGSDTWLWSSTDGGATWSAPSKISAAPMGTDATDPVLGPQAGEITIPTWNSGRRVFSARLDGGDALSSDYADLPAAVPPVNFLIYNLATAVATDGSLIATADSDTREATGPVGVWRVAPGGDPTLSGSWPAPTVLGAGSDSRLAGGPSGVFLSTLVPGNAFAVRKLQSGTTFGSPATVIGGSNASVPDLAVGAGGHVGLAWRINGSPNFELWFSRSGDGSSFAPGVRISDDPGSIIGTQIALAQDGNGFAVWESAGKTIRAASTDPLPVPTPAPAPAPSPTPTPGSGGGTRNYRSNVPGASITFGVPKGCVQPGQTFRVTLRWKKQKRKGNKFVKVTRADFYIGTKVVKKDRRAPFVQTLKVTASARRGSTITAARPRVHQGQEGQGAEEVDQGDDQGLSLTAAAGVPAVPFRAWPSPPTSA